MAKTVSAKEFNEFKKSTEENTLAILDAIKSLQKPQPMTASEHRRIYSVTGGQEDPPMSASREVESASATSSNYTLNPAHQAIFEEYFDPKDGFEARMDYPYFTIIVPMKFSNADAAWKKYYKTDTRMKFLKHDNIEGGMRDWCKLVARNLQYDRNAQRKN